MKTEETKKGSGLNLTKNNFGSTGWLIIFLCAMFMLGNATFAIDGQNIYVPFLSQYLSVSPNVLLMFLTPIGWITALTSILMTQMVYKKGPRMMVSIIMFVLAVIAIAIAFINSVPYFVIVIGLFQVFASGATYACHHAYMGYWFPKRKGLAMGWSTMGLPLASMVVVPLMSMAVSGGIAGWRKFCFIYAGIIFCLGLIAWFFTRNTPEELGKYPDNQKPEENVSAVTSDISRYFKSKHTVKSLLLKKDVWFITFGFGLPWMCTIGIISQIVPRVLDTGYFSNQMEAVRVLQVATVFGLIGSYFWGWLDAKISTKKTGVLFNMWYILALILLIFLDGFPKIFCYIIVSMVTFGAGGIANITPSMVITKFGRFEFASANRVCLPLLNIVLNSGFLLLAVGRIFRGWTGAYIVFVIACVLGAISVSLINDKPDFDDGETEKELIALAKADAASRQ
jgi:sugar phosphate permease